MKTKLKRFRFVHAIFAVVFQLQSTHIHADVPENFSFANAIPVTELPYWDVGTLAGAFLEENETLDTIGYQDAVSGSAWYSLSVTETTRVWGSVYAIGAGNLQVAVWKGNDPENLQKVNASVYNFWFSDHNLYFLAEANETYRIAVYTDGTADNFGFSLTQDTGGVLFGTVYEPDGVTPAAGLPIDVFKPNLEWGDFDWVGSASTIEDGTYYVGGLTEGAHHIGVLVYQNHTEFLTTFHGDVHLFELSQGIWLTSGNVSGPHNITMIQGAKISGIVTAAGSELPIANISVFLEYFDSGYGSWIIQASGLTDENGYYVIGGLPPREYRLVFIDGLGAIYAMSRTQTGVILSTGFHLQNFGMELSSAALIQGSVTDVDTGDPLEGIQVEAIPYFDEVLNENYAISTYTLADGSYALGGLAGGAYQLRFSDPNFIHVRARYESSPGNDTVEIDAESVNAGFDMSLQLGRTVIGTVTRKDNGEGVEEVYVVAYGFETDEFISETLSDSDGNYVLGGLPPGEYLLFFSPQTPGLAWRTFDSKYWENARPVLVADSGVPPRADVKLRTYEEDMELSHFRSLRNTGTSSFELTFTGEFYQQYILQGTDSLTGDMQDIGEPFECLPGPNALEISSPQPLFFWSLREYFPPEEGM
ncbi:MAG: carboxypeptidase regulatory-like domain-containing protein [Verrucomicrobia bacterium]|nr:carboxypeptidase regulatory-like domain-containing protein [Verrucomicrobiota bacterium]MCH8512137.1 carboxypeptidase-like regulatory domain-containing protein [Kiritimatiellia bacterium]